MTGIFGGLFKFIDFTVIELRFFKKNKMKNMAKMWKALFEIFACLTLTYSGYFSHILHLDIIKSEISFKLKVKKDRA